MIISLKQRKRKIKPRAKLNHNIYTHDLLGVAAPVVTTGKILYSETCLHKLKWNEQVPDDIRDPGISG